MGRVVRIALKLGLVAVVSLTIVTVVRSVGGSASAATVPKIYVSEIKPRSFVFGEDHLHVTVTVIGALPTEEPIELEAARAPYRLWQKLDLLYEPAGWSGRLRLPICGFDESEPGCLALDRNFKLRAALASSRSQTVLIHVFPQLSLNVTREDVNASPYVDLFFAATVHLMHHYPTGPAYFYTAPHKDGPYTLVATSRFHPGGPFFAGGGIEVDLQANARVYDNHAFYPLACLRHQLVRDMGKPFHSAWCGQRTFSRP